ncbi:MAG: hypothetical protein EA355_10720 [Rhodobacteraceae bacterium]|nr:MAG: hypothetical protein EA355_10720 [Paracoccaceae bacterium]
MSASDEAAREMMGRAVDAAPCNALTLALAAHALSFPFREHDCARALLDRAVAADPLHAIARDLRALTLGRSPRPAPRVRSSRVSGRGAACATP